MDLYIAVLHDRHIDDVIRVFSTEEKAREQCKAWLDYERQHGRSEDDIDEDPVPGWLYRARYGPEGDSVRIEHATLDAPD